MKNKSILLNDFYQYEKKFLNLFVLLNLPNKNLLKIYLVHTHTHTRTQYKYSHMVTVDNRRIYY